ncbi:hypothetical protein B484DRAFT_430860 [Ochromonadaceae sp. CCMP2298]|nr:hypothetical protein B484DRAFT_430860 [Ochromonadaceae sp. CCMP2298]
MAETVASQLPESQLTHVNHLTPQRTDHAFKCLQVCAARQTEVLIFTSTICSMQAKRQGDVRKGGAGLDDLADVAAGLPPAAALRKISNSTGKKSAQEVERPAKLPGIPGIPKAKGKSAPNNSKQQEGRGVVRNKGSSNVARDAAGDRLNLPSGPFSPRPGNKRPSMNSPEGDDNNDKKRPATSKVSAEKTSKGNRSQAVFAPLSPQGIEEDEEGEEVYPGPGFEVEWAPQYQEEKDDDSFSEDGEGVDELEGEVGELSEEDEEEPEGDRDGEEDEGGDEDEVREGDGEEDEEEDGGVAQGGQAPVGVGGRVLGSRAYTAAENTAILFAVYEHKAWAARKDHPCWKLISEEVGKVMNTTPRSPKLLHGHWVEMKSAGKSVVSSLSRQGVYPNWISTKDSKEVVCEKKKRWYAAFFTEITRRPPVPAYKSGAWWSPALTAKLWRYIQMCTQEETTQAGAAGALNAAKEKDNKYNQERKAKLSVIAARLEDDKAKEAASTAQRTKMVDGMEEGNNILQNLAASIATMATNLAAAPAAAAPAAPDPAAAARMTTMEVSVATLVAGAEDTKNMFTQIMAKLDK